MENGMTLYHISSEIYELLENGFAIDFVNEETGEIDEAKVAERLDQLNIDLRDKVDNIASYIKNLRSLSEQIKTERNALIERKKRIDNRVERLETYLVNCLTITGMKNVETARNSVRYTTSHPLNVYDESAIPDEYIKTTVTTKLDAMAIKKAIAAGENVPGCEIGTKYNIQIK